MAETSKIEWCDATFNPWIGCTKVGPGCDHCYAEKATPSRTLGVIWGPKAERHRTSSGNWAQPLRWEREHKAFMAQHGRRRRVFCASLADVFDNQVDPAWRLDLFRLIADTPHLDWLLVTKRIGNVRAMLDEIARATGPDGRPRDWQPMENVWLGITVVNQEEADRDIPKLLAVPARVRFLSMEPLLGPVDLSQIPIGGGHGHHEFDPIVTANVLKRAEAYPALPQVHWVIVGGESGPQARPMHPDWARSLRDQCEAAGVPFLFKQWGEWRPMRPDEVPQRGGMDCHLVSRDKTPPIGSGCHHQGHALEAMLTDKAYSWQCPVLKVGKQAAGRLLDGVEHNGFPEVNHG